MMRRVMIVGLAAAWVMTVGSGCSKRAEETPAATAPATAAAVGDAGASAAPEHPPIVQKDIEDLAKRILNAYKNKDLQTLAEFGPAKAKEVLIFLEPRNPHYQELLGDDTWRMKSLVSWDGKFRKMRIGQGVIKLYYNDSDEQTADVLELTEEGQRWVFHDIVQAPRSTYVPDASGHTTPPPPPRPAEPPMPPPPNAFPVHEGPAEAPKPADTPK